MVDISRKEQLMTALYGDASFPVLLYKFHKVKIYSSSSMDRILPT